jgi:hypothetical protein
MKKVQKRSIQGRIVIGNKPKVIVNSRYLSIGCNACYTHYVFTGEIIDNTKIYIMTPTRELAADGEQGQICVSGFPLAMGYVNKRGRNDNSFTVNPFNKDGKSKFIWANVK